MPIQTTVTKFAGGKDTEADVSGEWNIALGGTWRECDNPVVTITDGDGRTITLGVGFTARLEPSFLLTFKDKVYAACGETLAFSAIGEPSQFNDRVLIAGEDADAPGNGYITPSNHYGSAENIISLAHYQGRMALFARRSVQIWSMTADPVTNAQVQVLPNIGTMAPLTPQSLGDMDVLFLSDSGVRSLRVRDSSNNALVVDIGTPIDPIIQAHLATLSAAEQAAACAVVDPTSNRYWLFLPKAGGGEGTIYVLSYYPSAGISAWSTYRPTYDLNGTQTAFTPLKFEVHEGIIYARCSNKLVRFDPADYDACGMTLTTPWLDGQAPATHKMFKALDAAMEGTWTCSFGADYIGGTLQPVVVETQSTFQFNAYRMNHRGTHFKLQAVESGSAYARFSNFAVHYQPADAR